MKLNIRNADISINEQDIQKEKERSAAGVITADDMPEPSEIDGELLDEMTRKLAKEEGFENAELMTTKELFTAVFKKHVKREGADRLLDYITNETDFFTAPASTRFHGSVPYGLVAHSLHVYFLYRKYIKEHALVTFGMDMSDDAIALCSLLHDVCKANFYAIEMRNKKIDGVWQQVPSYTIDDQMPLGHGEKSAFIIMQYCHLNEREFAAIRYHMGFSMKGDDTMAVGNAFAMYPEAFALSTADMEATYFLENEKWDKRKQKEAKTVAQTSKE